MPLPKINPTTTAAWNKLKTHFQEVQEVNMSDLFDEDSKRATQFAIQWEDFYLDYSKNILTEETRQLLIDLAHEVGLPEALQAQFSGERINETEDRAVQHTALRERNEPRTEVKKSLLQMKQFSEAIISGAHKGYTGKPITHVVNIGIGGSHLGPSMVIDALQFYRNSLEVAFISNVDGDHVQEILQKVPRETTLFVIVSKTFGTQETLTNAKVVREWFLKKATLEDIPKHFVAVSTNEEAVKEFGIDVKHMFPLWNWVGGRFSLWSAVGLTTCCAIGFDHFKQLLDGAHNMDVHVQTAPLEKNMPVIMALLSVWYNNFFGAETEAVLPYTQYLDTFVDHLQQMIMESNGKSVDRSGHTIDYQTGTVVWGSTGTNAQHAFFQLIHQGTKLIPCDFICFKKSLHDRTDQHQKLVANCLAQTEALMVGTKGTTVDSNYKNFEGNKPSNTLLINRLTPHTLGSLIAMYEHKTFVQGVVWNIFSFDQWGVELGKKVSVATLAALKNKDSKGAFNASTEQLLKILQNE